MQMETIYNECVGYLDDCVATCLKCNKNKEAAKLFFVNIYPHKQSCHKCGIVLVAGFESEVYPNLHISQE